MAEYLEASQNPMTFGQRIVLDVVPYPTGPGVPTLYRTIVAAGFEYEAHGQPLTLLISEARRTDEIEGTGAGEDTPLGVTGAGGHRATYPIDWTLREIRAVVEFTRGGATYSVECDPGCCFTIPASSVSIKARIDFNTVPRYMSASITRGSVARAHELATPRFTSRPVITSYIPRADSAYDPQWSPNAYLGGQFGSNRVRIPPFARSFRAASKAGAVVCVTPVARLSEPGGPSYFAPGQEQRPVAGRIFCTSWGDMHPVPSHANNLYVMSAIDQDVVFVEFQLGF